MTKRTFAEKLEQARLLIFNSKDSEVASILENMGIDASYISRGEELYNETVQLVNNQKQEYHEKDLAYDKFHMQKKEAEKNFNRTIKLVKILSRNDKNLQNRLGLQFNKNQSINQWIEKAINFYNRLFNEIDFLSKLKTFKIEPEQLNTEKITIENLKQLRNKVTSDKGQAQEATRLKNKKIDELYDYTKELKAIAGIALEGQPQLLEKLGILVRS